MDKIDTIVKALKIICENNEIAPSDDYILDSAVRIYNTTRITESKANGAKSDVVGATDKQKETLKKFNIEFKPDISKKEASDLISKKIESFS